MHSPDGANGGCWADEEVVEVPLLLTRRQAALLEAVAGERGVTAGQLFRHLLWDFLGGSAVTPVAGGRPVPTREW